jgi:hypothetical protein
MSLHIGPDPIAAFQAVIHNYFVVLYALDQSLIFTEKNMCKITLEDGTYISAH